MKAKVLVVVLVLFVALSGCIVDEEQASKAVDTVYIDSAAFKYGNLRVVHDDFYQVTCWVYEGYKQGGISCIPDHQLPYYINE